MHFCSGKNSSFIVTLMRDVNHAHGLGMVSGESKRLLAYGEPDEGGYHHQHVHVPKMEVLNLISLFFGGFPLHKPYQGRIHTAYLGEDSSILGTSNVW